jgi:hypothetical protein
MKIFGKELTFNGKEVYHAGNLSSSGSAANAAKWKTARKLNAAGMMTGSVSMDGSADVSLTLYPKYGTCSISTTNTSYYCRMASTGNLTGSYVDMAETFYVSNNFSGGCFGIFRVCVRTNDVSSGGTALAEIYWLVNKGFQNTDFCLALKNTAGATVADLFYKGKGSYSGLTFQMLSAGGRGSMSSGWTLYNSNATTPTNAYAAMTDCNSGYTNYYNPSNAGVVGSADTASTAGAATKDSAGQAINTTYIKGLSVSGKTITYTKGNGATGTITTQDTVYTHPTSAGYKHVPSGGASGQILSWSASGTAKWTDPTVAGTQVITQTAQPSGHISGRVWVKTY